MTAWESSWRTTARRAPVFPDRTSAAIAATLAALIGYGVWRFARWAFVNATWHLPEGVSSAACRAARSEGACWAVVTERFRFILFGAYPFHEQWRPAVVCILFVLLYLASARRAWWRRELILAWIAVPALAVALLRGGWVGLTDVPTDAWGGLPLTFVLATIGFAAGFPVAVALALGRRSRLPAIRTLSAAYVELVRGVPMITFLFMAAVMFPLFIPQRITIDKLLRAQIALVLVIAAHVAEVVRGGLQSVPRGQYEAAESMGLRFWPAMLLVILPQALRVAIPALVNTFIAFFKDTSLVAVIGLFDLLGAAKAVIVDPRWVGFGVEVYLFVAAIYFAFCYAVSRYTRWLETALSGNLRS
jgi:general L-amino acid transport system permease protein